MQSSTPVLVGDILEMKKNHPCGANTWKVLRTGVDFRLKCTGCGHELKLTRARIIKSVKKIIRNGSAVAL